MTKTQFTRDQRFMRRAIELAERAMGESNPNPAVGCVLVRGGRIVGEGFHARAGSPHAEARALAIAGSQAKGATAYVTLEPCAPNPAKRTPPCAPRLIEAGVARVVFGVRDANPRVSGRGARLLRAVGVRVEGGVCFAECARLAQHFNLAMKRGRPFITLKAGMSLDGRIATSKGQSRWITSSVQRAAARRLRRLFDGVLIGIGTALADDPLLLPVPRTRRSFVRVVLDSRLRLPLASRLVRSARENPVILVCSQPVEASRRALEERGVVVLSAPGRARRVSVSAALRALRAHGVMSLMVEGGSEVLGSFVSERLFDELVVFRAPILLGGRGSLSVVGGDDPVQISDALAMSPAVLERSATLRYGLATHRPLNAEVWVPAARSALAEVHPERRK